MATLYTPAGGPTPQGQASQGLVDALQQITGGGLSPAQANYAQTALNYPAQSQAVAQASAQQQGMPGLIGQYGDQAKILDMFAHDQMLAQKYTAPSQMVASMSLPGTGGVPATSTPGMTEASNTASFGGLTDPGAITKAMGMDVSAHSNILDLVSKAVDFGSSQIQKSTSANADAYKSVMDVMSMLITADEKAKDRKLERDKISAQYGTGTGSELSLTGLTTKSQQAQYLRQQYLQAPTDADRTRISKVAKQMGITLTPQSLSTKEEDTVRTDIGDLQKMNVIVNAMNTNPNFPVGVVGKLYGPALTLGATGTLETLAPGVAKSLGVTSDTDQAIGYLTGMRATAERLMIGGRLTGYLLKALAPATPGAEKSMETNKKHLATIYEALKTDLNVIARNKGYVDAEDLANQYGVQIIPIDFGTTTKTGTTGRFKVTPMQ